MVWCNPPTSALHPSEVLMYDVTRYLPDSSPLDDLRALSLEEADVNFEVWQGGKAEELQKWLHDGFAASVGSHSMQGFDGLFTLKHTIDNYPEAEFYQYLQGPQLQWVFANNNFQRGEAAADPRHFCEDKDWNCTDFVWQPPFCRNKTTRCLGQVLHSYSHYSQGVMEQQIANNDLSLSVAYLTSRSMSIAIWNAFASKRDILFQHHSPSEGVDGVPSSAFIPIQFAPKRYGCNATEGSSPSGSLSCRLEGKPLLKIVSPSFQAEAGDALYFAQRFRLDEKSYDRLFELWRQNQDAYEAACSWLKETGSQKWGSWIRFSKQVHFFHEFPPTSGCFPTFYLFFILTAAVAIMHQCIKSGCTVARRCRLKPMKAKDPSWEPTDLSDIQRRMNDRANYTTPDFTSKLVARTSSSTYIQVKMALLRGSMGFMSFFRSEEDFCCDAGHAFLPPAASSCFRQYFQTSLQVLVYILTSGIGHIAASALTFAFATGMVGALLAEVRATVQKNKQVDPLLQMDDWYTNWLSNMQTITVSGWHWNPFFGGGSGVHPETWENTWDIYVYIYI